MPISRRDVLNGAIGLAGLTSCASAVTTSPASKARPNIIVLLADDLRYDAVGYLNNDVRTPHLDRLAKLGVRFHNTFVTTSICCTSRASILTSTYARRHGVWDFVTETPSSLSETSYPSELRNAGYRTAFFGKFTGFGSMNGLHDIRDPFALGIRQDRAAFDELEFIQGYYDPEDVDQEHHSNTRLATRAAAFIQSTPAQIPFCLSISFQAPHTLVSNDGGTGDIFVPEEDMFGIYAHDVFTRGPVMNEAAFATLPLFIRASEARRRWNLRFGDDAKWLDTVRKYYALVSGMDRAIGVIVEALDRKGATGDTVIIFSSDNGYFLGDYGLEGKWFGYEASIRIPLMIRPLARPKVQDIYATALNIDLAPTVLALAGIDAPSSMQGQDLSPLWKDSSAHQRWRKDFLYEHYLSGVSGKRAKTGDAFIPSSEGVRNERYTYLRYPYQPENNEQLFDRVADPNELKNIVGTAPAELVKKLRRRTDELIARYA
jgi:arylsulfatase A-like enzyme